MYIYTQPLWRILLLMLLLPVLWSMLEHAAGERRRGQWRWINTVVFTFSLLLILHITLLSREVGERVLETRLFRRVVGVSAHPEGIRLLLMNAFLFLPIGISLPELLPKKWRAGVKIALTAVAGFLLSLSIEVLQYRLFLGTAEVDDVLMNTLGALLGASGRRLFLRSLQTKQGTSGR